MDVMDIPWRLRGQIELISAQNAQATKEQTNGAHFTTP
jgi:hypothetical protein